CDRPRSSRWRSAVQPASVEPVTSVSPCRTSRSVVTAVTLRLPQALPSTYPSHRRSPAKWSPVIVDCAIYRSGVRENVEGDLSDALDEARERGDDCFLWIGLHEPTAEEFDLVKDELKLHPLAVDDAVHAHQRPKLEHYGDSLFVVLKTVKYDEATSAVELG